MKYPVLFALLTALFWGSYGHALGEARSILASPFKPYVMIGFAYLVWGILGGLIGMWAKADSFTFTGPGAMWSFGAGTLGAWGALTLTLAMFTGGGAMPNIVMPIVFGGAVTVSALVSIWTARGSDQTTSPWLWIGMVGIAIGIVLVASNAPHSPPGGGHAAKPAVPPPMADS